MFLHWHLVSVSAELLLVWNQLTIQAVLKHVVSYFQEVFNVVRSYILYIMFSCCICGYFCMLACMFCIPVQKNGFCRVLWLWINQSEAGLCMSSVLYPAKNEEIYGIVSYQNFSTSFCITFQKKTSACGSPMGHMCALWVSGSTGVTHFQSWLAIIMYVHASLTVTYKYVAGLLSDNK